jgi:hypothetical protein
MIYPKSLKIKSIQYYNIPAQVVGSTMNILFCASAPCLHSHEEVDKYKHQLLANTFFKNAFQPGLETGEYKELNPYIQS